MLLTPADPRLAFDCPQPVDRGLAEVRLARFPRAVEGLLAGQIGPLANLRPSPGCCLRLATDSPWLELRLARLRHHQPVAQSLAMEVQHADGVLTVESPDLRERDGDLAVRLATGLERGGGSAACALWLPAIATCAVAGVAVAEGALVEAAPVPPPRWLAIGDSLTQGFSCRSPLAGWVARLERRWGLRAWNLGVGGIRIEPEAFAWALAAQPWGLVTVNLGSNHGWRDSDAALAAGRALELARLVLAARPARAVWILPPWKPCEDGKGPPEYMGVPLDTAAGARVGRVRAALRDALEPLSPELELVDGSACMPHDHRWLPDGLHPDAAGFARFADAIAARLAAP
ncbi:MAG: SGNH/GDSL hydrolase family protein [Planctomycetes bacterium]|nr:SGNH/GDSL hydrolase family protein [Planctomycetota bacterium]